MFYGVYLISEGGYHRWPCFIYPIKSGEPGSPAMKCAAMIESVRKDIEGVFGILKKRFAFLKVFNRMHSQKQVDCAFVTCCIIHNILLRDDGFLDLTLPDLPNGVRERLKKGIGQEGHVLMMTGEMACGSVVLWMTQPLTRTLL